MFVLGAGWIGGDGLLEGLGGFLELAEHELVLADQIENGSVLLGQCL